MLHAKFGANQSNHIKGVQKVCFSFLGVAYMTRFNTDCAINDMGVICQNALSLITAPPSSGN